MLVDLNADVGESPSLLGDAVGILQYVTSASVAGGVHAGSPSIIRRTMQLARVHHVAVGAHPGLADAAGFGRREQPLGPVDAEDLVLYQVSAVAGMARAEGLSLQHVKLHGALYHMAARDEELAAAVAHAVRTVDPSLVMFGPPVSKMLTAARAVGLRVAREGFPDRAYEGDGSLVPRGRAGALIEDPQTVIARAIQMVADRSVIAVDGTRLPIEVDTICLHGDLPGAGERAAALREALLAAGVRLKAPGGWV
jgi:UPF0271 protein